MQLPDCPRCETVNQSSSSGVGHHWLFPLKPVRLMSSWMLSIRLTKQGLPRKIQTDCSVLTKTKHQILKVQGYLEDWQLALTTQTRGSGPFFLWLILETGDNFHLWPAGRRWAENQSLCTGGQDTLTYTICILSPTDSYFLLPNTVLFYSDVIPPGTQICFFKRLKSHKYRKKGEPKSPATENIGKTLLEM